MIFERKIIRKIFGPTRTDNGYWRIKTIQEINDILKGQNIIGFIKKQRLNWLGHVKRMAEDNIVQKIKRWKPMSKRPIGRPKTCEDDVFEYIKSINIHNWKKVAQNRNGRKRLSKPEAYIGCRALYEEDTHLLTLINFSCSSLHSSASIYSG